MVAFQSAKEVGWTASEQTTSLQADPAQFRSRQYSLDERRSSDALKLRLPLCPTESVGFLIGKRAFSIAPPLPLPRATCN